MTSSDLIAEWLEDISARNGLEYGLRELRNWARDHDPLERELVRSIAHEVVNSFLDYAEWCPTIGERRETVRRLVNAALAE